MAWRRKSRVKETALTLVFHEKRKPVDETNLGHVRLQTSSFSVHTHFLSVYLHQAMTSSEGAPQTAESIAADVVWRCQTLLHEMGLLRQRLFTLQGENQHISGLATQISSITTEKLAAESYLASLDDGSTPWRGNAEARFRSNNIPAVDQVWNIIKKCRHITSVQHRIQTSKVRSVNGLGVVGQKAKPIKAKTSAGKKAIGEDGVWVNAVVDGVCIHSKCSFFS